MNLVPNLEFSIKVVYFRRTMTLNLPVSKSMKTLIAAFFLLTSTVLITNIISPLKYFNCSEPSSELNISINGSEPHTGGGIYLYAKGIVYE